MAEKNYYPNLLIVSGTSARSGKTTMVCRLIEQLRDTGAVAIKVSPHFHTISPGLLTVEEGPGYSIYEETSTGTGKDTSRMLDAGAAKVFLVLVWDNDLETIFRRLLERIPEEQPVLCESPAVRKYFEPGLFIIMTSDNPYKRQDIIELQSLPHLEFKADDLSSNEEIPIRFKDGKWMENPFPVG